MLTVACGCRSDYFGDCKFDRMSILVPRLPSFPFPILIRRQEFCGHKLVGSTYSSRSSLTASPKMREHDAGLVGHGWADPISI
jgi:hypothetical protein